MAAHNIMSVDFLILAGWPLAVIQIKPAAINNTKATDPMMPRPFLITIPTIAGIDLPDRDPTGLEKVIAKTGDGESIRVIRGM